MRISKQISGNADERESRESQGRGEYEWIGLTEYDPAASELFGRRIGFVLPDGRSIDTGCVFSDQGEKQRIRTAPGVTAREVYPIWHAAAVLMLPHPNRDQNSWGGGVPVMRNGQYGIAHLHMRRVTLPEAGRSNIEVERVDVANHYVEESIDFVTRYRQVQQVWAGRDRFDDEIKGLLAEHEALVGEGIPAFAAKAGKVVTRLQAAMAESAADYGIEGVSATTDVLPTLLQVLQLPPILQPPPIDAIPPDEIEIRRRDIKEWRRWASCRGASSVRFRKSVRAAYRSTCIACGLKLPQLGAGANPGVDAAHILGWAEYDLDHVTNGLCFCKLHHWAFDDGLLEVAFADGTYSIVVPAEALARVAQHDPSFSIGSLQACEGPIPVERLPSNRREWPNPEYLRRLKESTVS